MKLDDKRKIFELIIIFIFLGIIYTINIFIYLPHRGNKIFSFDTKISTFCLHNTDCKIVDLERLCPTFESINRKNSIDKIQKFISDEQKFILPSDKAITKCKSPGNLDDYKPTCKNFTCNIESK